MALKQPPLGLDDIAEMALTYLVQNPEQLAEFMTITGVSPSALQRGAKDGSLAPGLLDYVVQNEPLLVAVCQSASISPEAVMRVWARLNAAE